MVDNMDTVEFRSFVLEIGFKKGYKVYTEYPVNLMDKKRPVDVVFIKDGLKHFIEIESGGEAGTSYAREGRERNIKVVAIADSGFILVKNEEPGKRLLNDTFKELNKNEKYDHVKILTWDEYRTKSCSLH